MKTKLLLITFSLVFISAMASSAMAQYSPYRLSDRDMTRLLDRIRSKSNNFRNSMKDALNKSRLDRTEREADVNAYVKDFDDQIKRLDDNFDHHRSTADDVDRLMIPARRIDDFMNRHSMTSRAQNDWATLRSDLEQLANAYGTSIRWGGNRGEYGGNRGGYGGDLPYRVSDREVEQLLHRIEDQSDSFRRSLDSALDRSRFNGSRREDDINALVRDYYNATRRLHDDFDRRRSTQSDVQSVLDRAAQIDQFMRRNRLRDDRDARRDWSTLRASLDQLAQIYNVSWRWGY